MKIKVLDAAYGNDHFPSPFHPSNTNQRRLLLDKNNQAIRGRHRSENAPSLYVTLALDDNRRLSYGISGVFMNLTYQKSHVFSHP
jgi:hypothetical protein